MKPPFSYVGNKFEQLPDIMPHLPYRKIWVEGMGGTGAVTWNRDPSEVEVFNDRYSGITDFYKCFHSDELFKDLLVHIQQTVNSREYFEYALHEIDNTTDIAYRAYLWFYICQASFSSLGKSWGRITSPQDEVNHYSKYRKLYNRQTLFREMQKRVKQVQIENKDYVELIADYDSVDTVWYFDPPYQEDNLYCRKSMEVTRFSHMNFLKRVFRMKGFVAVSAGTELREMYEKCNWDKQIKLVKRSKAKSMRGGIGNEARQVDEIDYLYIKE